MKSNSINKTLIFASFFSFLFSYAPYYDDKIMIYIDNRVHDFHIGKDSKTTSVPAINNILRNHSVKSIQKWLLNARPTDKNKNIDLNRYYVIEFKNPKNDFNRIINQFSSLNEISISEKIPIVRPAFVPNDSLWEELYGLSQIKADLAFDLWDIENGEIPGQMEEGEVVVAIPDVGFKWDHPDLINNTWQNLGEDLDGDGVVLEFIDGNWVFDPDDINDIDDDDDGYIDNFVGYNIAVGDNDPYPLRNNHVHGTKVAGNVSAVTNNGIGLASVGYSVKLMGVNASDNQGFLTHTYESVLAAAHMGADIINCSWIHGYSTGTEALFNLIKDEYGCISLGAAGNGVNFGGIDDTTGFNPWWPAAFESVIGVTALGANNSFNCWANVGEHIDIGAPGEYITCAYTYNDTLYALGTGTSYSTPLTAGAIALVKSVIPNATNETIISKVINTADYYPDMERYCVGQSIEGLVGSGQLNIYRAVLACTYPEILAHGINFQSNDGFLNPGDTITIDMIISNSLGFEDAENVIANLSTIDSMITIVDDQVVFNEIMVNGEEHLVQWIVIADSSATLGDIPFNIHFTANAEDASYENNVEFQLSLSFEQYGFPIENVTIENTPVFDDLDGNSLNEIYFGSDSTVFGKWIGGFDVPGFPFTADSEINTSIAAGDMDGDGLKEIVFGTTVGTIYVLNNTGTLYLVYNQDLSIIDVPVLSDLDQDNDLEIVFIAGNDSTSMLYVIQDNGDDFPGFPIYLSENIIVGPAIADLDNDMVMDIVITTSDNNIYIINSNGVFSNDFSFTASSGFTSPASLVDLDGDQDLEIIAGVFDGNLYVLHHNGTIMNSSSFNSSIRGVSIADIDDNGNLEIIFCTEDGFIHAWNPITELEAPGWPINNGIEAVSEPIMIDLDNDGDLEVMHVTFNGVLSVTHHDGIAYENFPASFDNNILATPLVGDIDNDGDYELIIGSLIDLQMVDIGQQKGNRYSWSAYRSNNHRDGFFDIAMVSIDYDSNHLPTKYVLGRNYPNPFNPNTTFSYSIPKIDRVIINVFDLEGRIVKTLLDNKQSPGNKSISWDATNHLGNKVSSGIYFYRMETESFSETKKMVLLK